MPRRDIGAIAIFQAGVSSADEHPPVFPTVRKTQQSPYSKEVFEYVNQANSLPVTSFAFTANPRNHADGPRDGSVPRVEPLLTTEKGEALVSIVRYMAPAGSKPVREVMISTITNAAFLIHFAC